MDEIYGNKVNGILTRLKMTHLQGSEKNLEKQKAESKIINKLTINGKTVSNQTDILNEQMKYYQKLYENRNQLESTYNVFENHEIPKLNEIQKQRLITLLPKSNKDLTNLSNWRPMSLLNVSYKIMMKAIANRIKKSA